DRPGELAGGASPCPGRRAAGRRGRVSERTRQAAGAAGERRVQFPLRAWLPERRMSHGNDGSELLVLSGADVRALVSMAECVEIIDAAMRTVSSGGAILPLRNWVKIPGTANLVGWMPGFLDAPPRVGVKLIGIFPDNPHRGLPSHCGIVTLFDPELGLPRAVLDAATVTSMRTAAASAVATRALARAGAGDLAILGTGEQAEAHLHALAVVSRLRRVRLWGRDAAKARSLAERAGAALGLDIE